MTATTVECICVWLDEDRIWIVSRDRLEMPSGNAQTTTTLSVFGFEDDAMEAAHRLAKSTGLPLYRTCKDQRPRLICVESASAKGNG